MRISSKKTRKMDGENYIRHDLSDFGKWRKHYQELIVTLISSKCSIGNVFLFHMYLVVSRTKIKFIEVLSIAQLIQ
jgi:hypothetical protein